MEPHRPVARLIDIVEAIELIRLEIGATSIGAFALDKRKQWVVERGLEIISEASRRLPESLKTRRTP